MNPLIIDSVVAVLVAVPTMLYVSDAFRPHLRPIDWWAYVLLALTALPLAVRRRYPIAVLFVVCGAYSSYYLFGYLSAINSAGIWVALYTVAVHRPPRVSLVTGSITFGFTILAAQLSPDGGNWLVVITVLVPVAATWALGYAIRRLGERNRQLAELTALLRRDREKEARRAVVDERVRIARELHDVVAHHMSVISLQVRVAQSEFTAAPEVSMAALSTVDTINREALDEMRRLLSVLRVDRGESNGAADFHDPQPGLDQLDDLVGRVRTAGVPVDVVTVGAPRLLPPGADLCAFRVIQESLTNVIKHARPARATVTLRYGPAEFAASVVDDGRNPVPADADGPAGHGVIGMRERAKLYSGTLTAGPLAEGGFSVALTLPVAAASGVATIS